MFPDWRPSTQLDCWYIRRLSRFSRSVILLPSGLWCSRSLGSGPLLCSDRWKSPSPCQAAQTNRPAIWLNNLPLLSPLSLPHPLFSAPANSYSSFSFICLLFTATPPFIVLPTWWRWSSGRTCWSLCPRKCHLPPAHVICSRARPLISFHTISNTHTQAPVDNDPTMHGDHWWLFLSPLFLLYYFYFCRSELYSPRALVRTSLTCKCNSFRSEIYCSTEEHDRNYKLRVATQL